MKEANMYIIVSSTNPLQDYVQGLSTTNDITAYGKVNKQVPNHTTKCPL